MSLCVYPCALLHMVNASQCSVLEATEWGSLLLEFDDVFFVPTLLPPNRSHDHRIYLKTGPQPINVRPYRHPPTQKDAIEVMVKELLDARVIRHSCNTLKSEHAAECLNIRGRYIIGSIAQDLRTTTKRVV
ncbi:hypothetical protein Tco_0390741 [Tanacetum coccineum]